jgi:hypothetical protein
MPFHLNNNEYLGADSHNSVRINMLAPDFEGLGLVGDISIVQAPPAIS